MNNFWKRFLFLLKNRFVIFGLFMVIFFIVQYCFSKNLLPSTENEDLWFYSGIFMVLFSTLFIEPYYTSPKNVLTNSIPLLLVFLAIRTSFHNPLHWWIAICIIGLLVVLSIIALSLEDKNCSNEHWRNLTATRIKNIVVRIGQGKVLYSAVFIYFLINYYSTHSYYSLVLFIIWFLILAINPKSLHSSFSTIEVKESNFQIGEIFGVQSKKIFLVKLYDDRKNINKFDVVKFQYSMQDSNEYIFIGIIFDTYLLNKEKWAKVLLLGESKNENYCFEKNIVYLLRDQRETNEVCTDLKIDNMVGIIIEGSTIGKIKFEYSKKIDDLQEGDLLELMVANKRLFYQVINGSTEKKNLEDKNEMGFIEGEAIQLGEWKNEELSFQKFGWVPCVNTVLYKADTSNILISDYKYPFYKIGNVPGTSLPSIINLDEAISHHLALLGVTGSGKSFLARELVNQIKSDTKVICVDFNKEFVTTIDPSPPNIISDENASEIATRIDWINNELDKFGNQQDKRQIANKRGEINSILRADIESFISDKECYVKVFELPDVSNTTSIFDYTRHFFRILFEIARERQINNNQIKICVVLEEAHTIIPEWNFSGSSDKASKGLVNSIGQIALQGRKYGIGFLVIAQRTANVSKTVLTQCNTVICFQAFDETSFNFLSNYIGKDMIQALPNLKQYHAILAGKALKSNLPLIVDLTRKEQ